MAFNLGKNNKDLFKKLKKLTPRQRLDYVNRQGQQSAATDLSQLTPAQFAELFPKYYQKGLPDVAGFREAISRRSSQKQDDINFGLSQGASTVQEAEQYGQWRRRLGGKSKEEVGQTISTVGDQKSISNKVLAKDIYNYLKSKGVDHNHAMGILANIQGESGFKPGNMPSKSTMEREGGPSGGLFQHHDNYRRGEYRFTNMVKAAGGEGVWQKNWRGQIDYALSEPDMKKYLSRRINNENEAVEYFIRDFERPAHPENDLGIRLSYLKSINSAVSAPDVQKDFSSSVSQHSSKSGGFLGGGQECVDLSKHFAGLGPASKWTFNHDAKIVAGSVIATTNYGNGNGGRHAADMPDKKSHYHTGIALTSPNSNGDVLILEQFQGQPARVAMINVNNYRGSGERMAVVAGGEPSANTLKAVEMGRGLANPDQLAWINSTGSSDLTVTSAQVKPVQEAPVAAKPTITAHEQQQQPATDQSAPATNQTATVEKAEKKKNTTESYKFDADKYWNEVKTKQPMADSMFAGKEYVMKETYKGFEEAQAAGAIKWDKKTNEIKILDPKHEKVQEIYTKMQDNNIDRNAFLKKSEAGGAGTAKVRHVRKSPFVETYQGFLPDVRHDVGAITGQWESGKHGAKAAAGVETVSTGRKDPGGVSYGRHQISSKKGTMADFLKSNEGEQFRQHFANLKPGTPKFTAAYKKLAAERPQEFDKAQHNFLARTHYTPFMRTAARLGYNVDDPRIQEAVWGGGIQFKNNMRKILNKASHSVGKSVEDQVMAIANAKQERAPKIKNRYLPEAQAILGQTPGGGFKTSNVMDMSKYDQYAMEQKSKRATYVAQHQDKRPETETKQVATSKGFDPYLTQSSAATATSATSTKETFERMRGMKADPVQRTQPEIPASVTSAPPDVTKETMQPVPDNKNAMNMHQTPVERRQAETTIDPGLNRQNREFSSASLERAIKNTNDPSGARHFGGTALGQ